MTAATPSGDHGAALSRVLGALAAQGTTPRRVGREHVVLWEKIANRVLPGMLCDAGQVSLALEGGER